MLHRNTTMYVLVNTSVGTNNTFESLEELQSWVQSQRTSTTSTSTSVVDEIKAIVEREVARRLAGSSIQPQTSEETVSEVNETIDTGIDDVSTNEHTVPTHNETTTDNIENCYTFPTTVDSYFNIDKGDITYLNKFAQYNSNIISYQDKQKISRYFNDVLCEDIKSYYTYNDDYYMRMTQYCLKLWLDFFDKFPNKDVPYDVSTVIRRLTKAEIKKLSILDISIDVDKYASKGVFSDMYDIYNYIIPLLVNPTQCIEELAYETLKSKYRYESIDDSNTTILELLKKWLDIYIYNIRSNSCIQSSVLLSNILKFLNDSPLSSWASDTIQTTINCKFLARYLAEKQITSIRKSAGIFYDFTSIIITKQPTIYDNISLICSPFVSEYSNYVKYNKQPVSEEHYYN